MHNELFSIGGITIYGYGLMTAIGILSAYFSGVLRARKYKIDDEPIFSILVFTVLFGYLGAKLLYLITILDQIIKDPSAIKNLGSGFVVYGGILTGILTCYLYCRIKKISFLTYLDLLLPSVALAQGFGRIGCLLAGCCYGCETSCSFSITFKNSAYAPNHVALFPSQIVSSGLDFLNFFVLCLIYRKDKTKGVVSAFYLIFYSVGRFIIEFFRGDINRGSVGTLSTSQFISLFVLAGGILMLILSKRKKA